ncbi:LysR family transcriptional regulator [Rhizobium ruizarguesonis]|jgi:DNA-binding transcriptional LysR family regulator|uniref:LysR family transcriptional regulator n=1 Tax=Rhizobium beringeri TaxID=3019934 RepID=A0ABY1XVX0_9HYPH|nr:MULTISPECIES: LysR family transcriptional regulator [Rhizobium]QIO43455.1 LysR family transcriptional regulator [Rhizobium leguminosarum bv. trifolii]QJS27760.1 LysR family transcriptional regulator [Rhizobium leguminosarum bv. trifolii TA1]MBY2917354.1 LysR family transcriptional regulator [Rhizobium leguminosarum]MBY2972593.1 LysR family transcriptional regulator [Rhizobium leguminosarum]MBY2979993.1 LysR family transcriptional regulator [Rhizobium leguminosarum]
MRHGDFSELAAFIAVAEAGSFTRASAKLGLSQSAVSYSVRMLEQRLGVRLISRTTRSLSLTDAGERMLRSLRPAFEHIESEIAAVTALRDKPAGTIRITTFRYAAMSVLWPVMTTFLAEYPDIEMEVILDEGLTDIVAGRFDAGIRIGEQVQKDMVAVRIGPDLRMAVVGSPSYFQNRTIPMTPRDLGDHRGISYRQTTGGGLYAWEFERDGEELVVRMNGPLIINDSLMLEAAALDGLGLAYTFESQVSQYIADGRLIRVLDDWCQPFPGYHLYYPSRRQHTAAFALLVEALRFKG